MKIEITRINNLSDRVRAMHFAIGMFLLGVGIAIPNLYGWTVTNWLLGFVSVVFAVLLFITAILGVDHQISLSFGGSHRVYAPWTDEQVATLKAWQEDPRHHPFTWEDKELGQMLLTPTRDGWVDRPGSPVVQTWAHDFMLKAPPPQPSNTRRHL